MPYPPYSKVSALEGTEKVGSKQCVALVQTYVGASSTATWSEGKAVMGQTALAPGTAIATFVGGKYLSHASGNHAALYMSQDEGGMWVMDQWADDNGGLRLLSRAREPVGRRGLGGKLARQREYRRLARRGRSTWIPSTGSTNSRWDGSLRAALACGRCWPRRFSCWRSSAPSFALLAPSASISFAPTIPT